MGWTGCPAQVPDPQPGNGLILCSGVRDSLRKMATARVLPHTPLLASALPTEQTVSEAPYSSPLGHLTILQPGLLAQSPYQKPGSPLELSVVHWKNRKGRRLISFRKVKQGTSKLDRVDSPAGGPISKHTANTPRRSRELGPFREVRKSHLGRVPVSGDRGR